MSAVVFDLGGVLTESPMTAFAAYEAEAGLPDGLIRQLNSTDPHTNAWARFERNELDVAGFSAAFEAEALAAGHRVEAARVLEALRGELRPAMVAAVRRLREAGLPLALLSNNVAPMERTGALGELLGAVRRDRGVVGRGRAQARAGDLPAGADPARPRPSAGRSRRPTAPTSTTSASTSSRPARSGFSTIKVVDPADALAELSELVGFPLDGAGVSRPGLLPATLVL